jgi:hypothetical protein
VQLAVALNFKVINALHGEMFTNALSTVELVGFDEMPIQDTRLCATDNAVEHLQQVWRSALHQVAPVKSLRDKIIACVSFLTVDEYKDKYRDTLSDVQVAFEQGKDFGNEDALKFLDRKKYGRCRHTATLKHWCTHLCEHSHSDRTRHRSETRIRFAEDVALE